MSLNEYNWLQAMENNIDTAHNAILHHGTITQEVANDPSFPNPGMKYLVANRAPVFDVRDAHFGVSAGASRPAEAGSTYWRTTLWLWPFYTMGPTSQLGTRNEVVATVPVDDYHNMEVTFNRWLESHTDARHSGGGRTLPNTSDWLGRFRNPLDSTTDFDIDRALQRLRPPDSNGFSGIAGGVPVQDEAMKWSQGRVNGDGIVDRSREHLSGTDALIVRVRQQLIQAARALHEEGVQPPCVDEPTAYVQRSGWTLLSEGIDYWTGVKELREAFQAVPAMSS
jgi:phenylpropionate dioxygenase-like ring-hydroxylating dioxygenase large terminal subunit